MPPLLLMVVSKNHLSSHGALLLAIRAWKASILTQFLVMGVSTFFNMFKGIVIGLFLTMALSKMSEHGGRDCGGGANQETGSDGLI
jgi:MFS superfamily sulfate permease-like transporter